MYFSAEEGGTPTPYMGAHCRHVANTISHLKVKLLTAAAMRSYVKLL